MSAGVGEEILRPYGIGIDPALITQTSCEHATCVDHAVIMQTASISLCA
jgi:hypothetical protein